MANSEEMNKEHSINQSEVIDQRVRYVRVDDFRDDEISLKDLVCVFIKWKSLFLTVVLLVTLLGVGYSFNKPVLYVYSVSVEIGNRLIEENLENKGRLLLVEDAATLLNKVNKLYIPTESQRMLSKYTDKISIPSVTAAKTKKGNIVTLESKGTLENEAVNIEFLNALVNRIILDHQIISTVYRKALEPSSVKANNALQSLNDDNGFLLAKQARLKDKELSIKKRIGQIKKYLSESEVLKRAADKIANKGEKALASISINNNLQAVRDRLFSLEQQLNFELKEEKEYLENTIAENVRSQFEQQAILNVIKMNSLQVTRALSEPIRSINPVGISKGVIILLPIMVAVFAAVFMVMIVEFISKFREQP